MRKLFFILFFAWIAGTYAQEVPTLETYTLKNGLKIHLMKYGKVEAINVRFVVNTGEKNEIPGQQGYCEMVSTLLLQGNSKYTQEQQNNMAFKLGGELSSSSGKDHTTISANFLTRDFDTGMDLFSSAILKPLFDKEKVSLMISYLIDYNNPSKMDISELAEVFTDLFLYGTANPLGRNYYKAQLQLVTPEKLKEYHAFNFTPKNSAIVICGNFDPATIKATVEKYFGSWQSTYGEVNGVSLDGPQIKKKEIAFINRNKATQCRLQWNKMAPAIKDKDALLFSVANAIFNRTLFVEIREKGGKTYGINSGYRPSQFSNLISIGCSVRSEEMLNTINLFDKTLQNFSTGNITQDEFDNAVKSMKIGAIASEMPADISALYNPIIYDFQKRKNYLNDLAAVKMEDVQKVIRKYYTPDSYKLVLAGDENVLNTQLASIKGLVKFKPSDIEKDN